MVRKTMMAGKISWFRVEIGLAFRQDFQPASNLRLMALFKTSVILAGISQ